MSRNSGPRSSRCDERVLPRARHQHQGAGRGVGGQNAGRVLGGHARLGDAVRVHGRNRHGGGAVDWNRYGQRQSARAGLPPAGDEGIASLLCHTPSGAWEREFAVLQAQGARRLCSLLDALEHLPYGTGKMLIVSVSVAELSP
jgi:hypothetical protein